MALTEEEKLEFVDLDEKYKTKGNLSDSEKIRFVDLNNKIKQPDIVEKPLQGLPATLSEPTFLDKYGKYISVPMGIAGQALGGLAGGALGTLAASPEIGAPVGGVAGYAGSQALYRGAKRAIEGKPVTAQREASAVLGDIEAGALGEALPIIGKYLKPVMKPIADVTSPVAKKLVEQAYLNVRGQKPSGALKALKETPEIFAYTPEQVKKVEEFKQMGLPQPTPAQMQQKLIGEPTPAQYVEGLLANKDPETFMKLEQQQNLLNDYIQNKFLSKGEINAERAGKKIGNVLQSIKQKEGEKIGEVKKTLEGKPISSQNIEQMQYAVTPRNTLKLENSQIGYIKNEIVDRLPEAKTMRDLDDLKSKVTGKIKEELIKNEGQGNNFTKELEDARDLILNTIEERIPVESREPYRAYAALKDLEQTTLKGALDPRKAEKIVDKVMASGKDTEKFIKIANQFNSPELVTTVKEQFLREIFESSNPKRTWDKVVNDESTRKLLTKEQITEVNNVILNQRMIESTRPRTLNPSGTALTLEKMITSPKESLVNSIIGKVLGEEKKTKDAAKLYKAIQEKSLKGQPLKSSILHDYLIPKSKYIPTAIRSGTSENE